MTAQFEKLYSTLIKQVSETHCFVWTDRAANIHVAFILLSRPEDKDRRRIPDGQSPHWTTSSPRPFNRCARRKVALGFLNDDWYIFFFFLSFFFGGGGVSTLKKTPGAPENITHPENYNTAYTHRGLIKLDHDMTNRIRTISMRLTFPCHSE